MQLGARIPHAELGYLHSTHLFLNRVQSPHVAAQQLLLQHVKRYRVLDCEQRFSAEPLHAPVPAIWHFHSNHSQQVRSEPFQRSQCCNQSNGTGSSKCPLCTHVKPAPPIKFLSPPLTRCRRTTPHSPCPSSTQAIHLKRCQLCLNAPAGSQPTGWCCCDGGGGVHRAHLRLEGGCLVAEVSGCC